LPASSLNNVAVEFARNRMRVEAAVRRRFLGPRRDPRARPLSSARRLPPGPDSSRLRRFDPAGPRRMIAVRLQPNELESTRPGP
jgi:hypothetical protein